MVISSSYWFIIQISIIIIISYFFNRLSERTNIPAVLMLIAFGILLQLEIFYLEIKNLNLFPVLEVLGIVGLILIVLEAALDLKLKKEQIPLIRNALIIAFISGLLTAMAISTLFVFSFHFPFKTALIYAIPLSIMSSAIVIPSISSLSSHKKEFMIYESTFSDILGIMFYYFTLQAMESTSVIKLSLSILGNISLTIIISLIVSYLVIIVFQNIKTEIKLFLLIAVLLLFYSIAKIFHISALLIILVFGLVLNNSELFFFQKIKKYLKIKQVSEIYKNFKLLTLESSFVVRTLFFIVFGLVISLNELWDWKVLALSLAILGIIYGLRYISLKIILKKDFSPELFIAPRGLISILLFFAIPENLRNQNFESGILLYIILITSILMTLVLIKNQKIKKLQDEEIQLNNRIKSKE